MKNKLKQDLQEAMKAGDKLTTSVLRMLTSAIKEYETAGKQLVEAAEGEIVGIIQKSIKQRKSSAETYREGGREELAKKEEEEICVLEKYLPEQLSAEELGAIVGQAIEAGADNIGAVMGAIKEKVAGKADMSKVSQLIKEKLG